MRLTKNQVVIWAPSFRKIVSITPLTYRETLMGHCHHDILFMVDDQIPEEVKRFLIDVYGADAVRISVDY